MFNVVHTGTKGSHVSNSDTSITISIGAGGRALVIFDAPVTAAAYVPDSTFARQGFGLVFAGEESGPPLAQDPHGNYYWMNMNSLEGNRVISVGIRGGFEGGDFVPYTTCWTHDTNGGITGDPTNSVNGVYVIGYTGDKVTLSWREANAW
jgi:hypothetical protein